MPPFESDPVDRRLRDVPSPAGLDQRLKSLAREGGDARSIDERLASVPVPAGLETRLSESVLDESLRQVPVPAGLEARLRRADHRRRWLAVAATLALMTGLGWLALRGGDDLGRRDPLPPLAVLGERPVRVDQAGPLAPGWAGDLFSRLPATLRTGVVLSSFPSSPLETGPAGQLARDLGRTWNPLEDTVSLWWEASGLEPGVSNAPAGPPPPLFPAYPVAPRSGSSESRELMMRRGTHVPVFPGRTSASMAIDAPLRLETASYDRARDELSDGRLPESTSIRVEDFLAATHLPQATAAAGQLALRTAAGPAPFGRGGSQLLYLAVQAGPAPRAGDEPTHLVVAVDASAGMAERGCYDTVCRVLDEARHDLRRHDRLSVVLFSDRVDIPVWAASRADIPSLLQVLAQVEPSGPSDPGRALGEAIGLFAAPDGDPAEVRRVVVIASDAGFALPSPRLDAFVAAAVGDAIDVDWILIGDRLPAIRTWSNGTRVSMAGTSLELRRSLGRALAGRPNIVARDVRLAVSFDPASVVAFRLVGHAPGTPRVAADTQGVELDSGQSAAVLFEVWLHPHGESDRVATAELEWTDPRDGRPRVVHQPISRVQFAPVLNQAPLSLQMAALAAELGERLADGASFEIRPDGRIATFPKPRETASLRAAATSVRLREYRGYHDYEDLLSRLQRLWDGASSAERRNAKL